MHGMHGVANRIEREDMKILYYLKQEIRKPITRLVAEAVKQHKMSIAHTRLALSLDS